MIQRRQKGYVNIDSGENPEIEIAAASSISGELCKSMLFFLWKGEKSRGQRATCARPKIDSRRCRRIKELDGRLWETERSHLWARWPWRRRGPWPRHTSRWARQRLHPRRTSTNRRRRARRGQNETVETEPKFSGGDGGQGVDYSRGAGRWRAGCRWWSAPHRRRPPPWPPASSAATPWPARSQLVTEQNGDKQWKVQQRLVW